MPESGHARVQIRAVRRVRSGRRAPGARHDRRVSPYLRLGARQPHTVRSWTRSGTRTPPAPASARPSWPAATTSCAAFDVVLERVAQRPAGALDRAHRPARRRQDGAAQRAALGGGPARLGHRQARGAARPAAAPAAGGRAAPGDPRARATPQADDGRPGARRAQGLRRSATPAPAPSCATAGSPGIDVPAVTGRADSGDIEIDLVELLTDVGGLAADVGRGVAIFIDEMQDLGADDVSALCAACHEICQSGLPLVVVGAGLPHLPAVLSASKSYSERLFRYARIDRLDRAAADRALRRPARDEDADFTAEALDAMYAATAGYPYFVQAYGKVAWDVAPRLADHRRRRRGSPRPRPRPSSRSGSSGRGYERATPAEREYLRAMADAGGRRGRRPRTSPSGRESVPTVGGRRAPGPQAAVAVAGPGRAAEEGPDLLRRARPDRLHRAALRPLPAGQRLTTSERSERGRSPLPFCASYR